MRPHRRGRFAFQALRSLPIVCGIAAAATSPTSAQERAVTQLQVRAWNQEHGLPVNAVTALRQTEDGYLWIGTETGLARFDGARLVTIGTAESPLYTSAHVLALAEDREGVLWVGTTTGLIRRERSRDVRWTGEPEVLAGAYVQAIHVDPAGRIWVGTNGEGIFLIEGPDGAARRVPTRGFEPRFVRAFATSRGGLPWVATDEGLARVGAGGEVVRARVIPPSGDVAHVDVRDVLEDRQGRVWLATRGGLYRVEGERLLPATESGPLRTTLVRALTEDDEGRLWAATSGSGLFRLTGDRWEQMNAEHGLPGDDLHALTADVRGDLWVGTGVGIALVYAGDVLPITTSEGLSSPVALPVLEARDGALWVGTFGGGLNRISNGEVQVFGPEHGLPNDVVLSLAEDMDGSIWIGTRGGLVVHDRGTLRPEPSGALETALVGSLLAARDGRVWAASSDEVVVISGSDVRRYGVAEGLSNPSVLTLNEAGDGSVLVGTQGGGAYRIRADRVEPLQEISGLDVNVVYDFHEGHDGSLWLGTGSGLLRVRGGERTIFGRQEGISSPDIPRILPDDQGDLWISTSRGVHRVSLADLEAVAAGERDAVSPIVYTERDGMPSSETNGGFSPAGWKGLSGRLFFPTMKGVAVFDPARTGTRSPLRVLIEGIENPGDQAGRPRSTDLPPEAGDIGISYTALDFRHGDQAEFRYRLVGYDTAWVQAGQRRTAYYTHLPPGRYAFAVEARLPGQPWVAADPLSLQRRPYLHETVWFRAAVALLILALAVGLHRWRVTYLERREKELLELVRARETAERKYREIFENARELVITLDGEGRIEEANREACAVLGRDAADLAGTPLAAHATADPFGDGNGDGAPPIEEMGTTPGLLDLTLLRPDGSGVKVEASVRELRADGQRRGYQLIGRDVTERHHLEERLRHSQRMEAVGLLAGGVAHDFNNILSVIKGYTTFLLDDAGDADTLRADTMEISDAADRAAALTHQLLTFSRKQTLQPRVLQLNEIVRGMEKLLRRLIGEDIQFVVELAPDLWRVTADPGQMEQVVTNLAVNARDAMPDGGTLTISTRNLTLGTPLREDHLEIEPGDYAVLRVSDTGFGMSAEVRARMFDPFFTTKPTGKGTGLGLATVHGIVQQSGGHIQVDSAPGKGSTFLVYLPRELGAQAPVVSPAAGVGGAAGDETVLLVEDDESIRRLIRRVLERNGYHVLEAADPVEALDEVLPRHPGRIHLLLTDVVMPHGSGPELADRLTAMRPDVKTIFMSGYTDDRLAERVDTHRLLRKPFDPRELLMKIREVIEEQARGRR